MLSISKVGIRIFKSSQTLYSISTQIFLIERILNNIYLSCKFINVSLYSKYFTQHVGKNKYHTKKVAFFSNMRDTFSYCLT